MWEALGVLHYEVVYKSGVSAGKYYPLSEEYCLLNKSQK